MSSVSWGGGDPRGSSHACFARWIVNNTHPTCSFGAIPPTIGMFRKLDPLEYLFTGSLGERHGLPNCSGRDASPNRLVQR